MDEIEGLERRNVPQGSLEPRPDEAGGVDQEESEHQTAGENEADDNGEGAEDETGDAADSNGQQDNDERPRRRNMIGADDEIVAALHRLRNQKLIDLYTSIGSLRHPQHTLLAVIGCWSFLECMTRAHGRPNQMAFDAWINQNAGELGVAETPDRRLRRMALDWISTGGNITKHDWQGAAYDMRQLFNFMDALKPIIVAMIDDTADRQS